MIKPPALRTRRKAREAIGGLMWFIELNYSTIVGSLANKSTFYMLENDFYDRFEDTELLYMWREIKQELTKH